MRTMLLLLLLLTSCTTVDPIPEQYKQTADHIRKGVEFVVINTDNEIWIKPDMNELLKLTIAHSEQELGLPKEPLAKEWNSKVSEEQRTIITENQGLHNNPIFLVLLILVARGVLKSTGIYLPEGSLLNISGLITEKLKKKKKK